MQRKDVQVGVEYAVTGALAYGREPDRNSPRKARFTDTRPGPWWRVITLRYVKGASVVRGGYGWETVNTEIVHSGSPRGHEVRELPTRFGSVRPDQPKPGDECTYLDTMIKGGLPGEFWDPRTRAWVTALVVPASIHRTWAEVEDEQRAHAERDRALDEESRVDEVKALFDLIGLGTIIRPDRGGHGVKVHLYSPSGGAFDGKWLLAELTAWAQAKGLI